MLATDFGDTAMCKVLNIFLIKKQNIVNPNAAFIENCFKKITTGKMNQLTTSYTILLHIFLKI